MRDQKSRRRHIINRVAGAPEAGIGAPVVKHLVGLLIDEFTDRVTLLAVCPNSKAVTRGALLAAREAHAPLLLAATLNQVDVEGGYTEWTPASLMEFLREESARLSVEVPVLTCLDHGGPWLKDRHTSDGLDLAEAMARVKTSLEACIDAGYALLHIDPTVDRRLEDGEIIPIDWVIDRTLSLIEHAETYRRRQGHPPVAYEVGTEEVHGGLADMETFRAFLQGLDEGLREREIVEAWPAFVVGKVGTDLDTSYFNPVVARRLTEEVKPYRALIKGHYTDGVENPEDYPRSGMGGANVGPEFTEVEFMALSELMRLEETIGLDSGLDVVLREAVIESGRWEKWLHPDERGQSFLALTGDRQEWLIRTGCRYIWTHPAVVEARARLYANVAPYRDADAFVVWRIKESILRYYHCFNLIGFQAKIGV